MTEEYDFSRARRGPVIQPPPGKTRITIRLDDDVLEWFRQQADAAGGANYQTLLNHALREYIGTDAKMLEKEIRRVVREELATYSRDQGSDGETRVALPAAQMNISVDDLVVWKSTSFAPKFYRDALQEARSESGAGSAQDAVRREIIFAVCFAESYLVEWVRDNVGVDSLVRYFPAGRQVGIRKRWREVIEQLYTEGLAERPVLDNQTWQTFCDLVKYRNGLVHGGASLPETDDQPTESRRPFPSLQDLQRLESGYAVDIVRELTLKLHEWTQTDPPAWLANRQR